MCTRTWYRVCSPSIRVLVMYFSIFGISPNGVPPFPPSTESSPDFFAFLSLSSFGLDEFNVDFVFPAENY